MVVAVPPPPTLSPDIVSLFYIVDDLLARSPLLVFYGPSATPTAAANNSRIQAHIFSPAGLQSYPRLTISPSSPLYAAVNCLPREEQGDEICRGLAYSLYKYFSDLSPNVKQTWEAQPSALRGLQSAPTLFSDAHAAILAQRMVKVSNVPEVIKDLRRALAEQTVSWLDTDVVLPPGSMKDLEKASRDSILPDPSDEEIMRHRFGEYAPLVELFGEPSFLPTARLKRRPSKPTCLNRSSNFTRTQKENIRREFCELLDTEERYVGKLYDLVHSVAADFREKARAKDPSSASPSEDALRGLFPPSLDKILEVNSAFLEDLRRVVEETENDAIQDIESTPEAGSAMPQVPDRKDVTGTLPLSACFRSWFPRFAECYSEYTNAQPQMSHFLRQFMKETGSSFSKRMQETGEQRLTSMLIEPVQRLPRYNLYIDSLLKQLPARHAAVKGLLKARDIISEICAHDAMDVKPDKMNDNLRSLVASWPPTFRPHGRLVTAVDVVELPPPYRRDVQNPRSVHGILLLFTDHLVVIKKASKHSLGARGLTAQLDGSDVARNDIILSDLTYRSSFALDSFDLTEMDDDKLLHMLPLHHSAKQLSDPRRPGSSRPGSSGGDTSIRVYELAGSYLGKGTRFSEELVQARVEGRFPETIRESQKWEVRSTTAPDLSFFSAVFEDTPGSLQQFSPARVRVMIEPSKDTQIIKPGKYGVEVVATLSVVSDGFYKLEMVGTNDFSSKDQLTGKEFLPVLAKRLNNFLQMKCQIRNPALAATLLLRNQTILQSLTITVDESHEATTKERASRPHSPVKLLTNFFSSGSISREPGSLRKHHSTRSETNLGEIPNLRPPPPRRPSNDVASKPSTPTRVVSAAADALAKLEETLASYILALQARKGNIVGRVLRSRSAADELAVNELYNALLEDPANYEVVAQASVDVLFCAFEKFVKIAWHDKIGSIIPPSVWKSIQTRLDSGYPGDFEDFFRGVISDLSPQNQRALRACVRLLVDLLDGTGNDGDRGVLTASFAEVLVPEGSPTDFVSVLDRLVEDIDLLLENPAPSNFTTPHGSISEASIHRQRTVNSSSLTSNASLRKKFGLSALTRKGSKSQDEDKTEIGSVWRALSKSKHEDRPNSFSKAAAINRSNSTDMSAGHSPKRPVSRDRPTILGAFNFENSPLASIHESVASIGPPRKKRRSSLSDLRSLHASAGNTPSFMASPTTPSQARRPHIPPPSPATPSPTKHTLIPAPAPTVTTQSPPRRDASPIRALPREGSPIRVLPRQSSPIRALPRPLSIQKTSTPRSETPDTSSVTIKSIQRPSHQRNRSSISGIPTLKSPNPGLSERPSSGNVRKLPPHPSTNGSPEKPVARLRMQSPQKLRERVQNNQKIFESAGASFQDEIAKITEEIKGSRNPSLESKVNALAAEHTALISGLQDKLDALAGDVSSSLQVSESRYRKLDELWKETSVENEMLYARFNEELAKVVGQIKTGEGLEEVRRRLAESGEENARLKRENMRLRRENLGLKAQLRE